MRILVTGGAGFVGSHTAEFYAKQGHEVIVFDNLSRAELLGKEAKNTTYNWDYLKKYKNIKLIKGDVRNFEELKKIAADNVDAIIHTAGQTAVTTSVVDPAPDFSVNVIGTFNVLECARQAKKKPKIVYCSTNKVYGDNVNIINLKEIEKRYEFKDSKYLNGLPENFSIDHTKHTPYGCSKLSADLYMQDYARLYDLNIGVFRMSCIYGTRQFGFEDQGWIAWFSIAAITEKPITIFGDGKQVRDVLYVTDLVLAYDAFIKSDLDFGVFNTGGGIKNTLSLLELLDKIKIKTEKKSKLSFDDWRPSDQKVYISDISHIKEKLKWEPKVSPDKGIDNILDWVSANKEIF